jgi:hypothetical protein
MEVSLLQLCSLKKEDRAYFACYRDQHQEKRPKRDGFISEIVVYTFIEPKSVGIP